jgi:hypothetical protein
MDIISLDETCWAAIELRTLLRNRSRGSGGFGDLSYFNCVFRRTCGEIPSDKRQWSIEGSAP